MPSKLEHEVSRRPERFCRKYLTHVKGEWAGEPMVLEPWQKKITREVFGTLKEDGSRQYRTLYVEIPRKNGKSTWAAALALYLLFWDQEPGAEIYSCAADRFQAAIVFDMARQMVKSSAELSKRCKIFKRSIVIESTGSAYHVISADAETKHGLNPHGIIFDELHVQPNRRLWDTLTSACAARRQPLTIAITTAGYDRNSICWEIHSFANQLLDPKSPIEDSTFYPVIFGADEGAEWTDPETWEAANPNYGISVKPEFLESECYKAQHSPARENTFKRLYLNLWTEQDVLWLPMDKWDECDSGSGEEGLLGQGCFGGLDLSSTTDLSAFELFFPKGTRALSRFWVPADNIAERVKRDKVPYDVWVSQGLIEATEGNIVDYGVIRKRINQLGKQYNIREIAYDRWNATQLVTELQGDGFTMVPFGQGFQSMAMPCRELEKMVIGKKLDHGGNPVLRWCAQNVSVKQDPAGNLKPAKDRSRDRIDGVVALLMAIGRAAVHAESGDPQGMVVLEVEA